MREIKFRMWDKRLNKMYYTTENWYYENEYCTLAFKFKDDVGYGNGQDIGGKEKYELMQYTGLKDKNGREIYEGDIIAVGYNTPYGDEKSKGVAIYSKNNLSYMLKDLSDNELYFFALCANVEVIGNKYEHPELIDNES